MDTVHQIAEAIAGLGPAERQRLFRLLVDRGHLPAQAAVTRPAVTEPALPAHQPPDYILIFDGGSKGNPGWGYGSYAITRVQDGAQRLERLEFGDKYTNNEAEYDALIAALQDLLGRIKEAGRQPNEFALEIRGDSSLVIKQLQGEWQAKEPRMRDRRDRCRRLLEQFGATTLVFHPREQSVRVLGH